MYKYRSLVRHSLSSGKNAHYHGNISTTNRGPHPAAISDTHIAQDSQNRACAHDTSAKPARRGTTRHSSQQSSEVDAAATVADSDAAEVVSAGRGA